MLCGQCFREMGGEGVCPACGFDSAQQREKYPVALLPGSILNGQYVVGRVLGQGGFGITYLAMDDRAETRVCPPLPPRRGQVRNRGLSPVAPTAGTGPKQWSVPRCTHGEKYI